MFPGALVSDEGKDLRNQSGRGRGDGGASVVILIIVVLLMGLLLLKGLGILQAAFGIDPVGYDVTIDVSSLASLGLFAIVFPLLWQMKTDVAKMDKTLNEDISEMRETLAVLKDRSDRDNGVKQTNGRAPPAPK